MHYQFPADISQRLEACIAGGRFANEDEVLRNALDALEERDRRTLDRWHEGNAVANDQSRRGLSRPLDDDAVLTRLRARLAAEGIVD